MHERADVFAALAQRRHVDVDDAQPVQQVFAELAVRHHVAQVAVGGGDDAHVHLGLHVVGADGLHLAVLEKPQQQRLHAQAHLADFVEEERAAVRELQLARLVAVRAGEAALHVAEQLRFEQRLGEAGAVHRDEGREARAERTWISRATRSLPTPLSPVMSTFVSRAATRPTSARMSAICWLALTMSGAALRRGVNATDGNGSQNVAAHARSSAFSLAFTARDR